MRSLVNWVKWKTEISWKNYVLGEGASEDIYTGTISTEGDWIVYDTEIGCVGEAVYYNQGEEPWASLPYGGNNIRSSGCGPTALAIVISTLTGEAENQAGDEKNRQAEGKTQRREILPDGYRLKER